MQDLKSKIDDLVKRLAHFKETVDIEKKKNELEDLEIESSNANLWQNQEKARAVMQKLKDTKKELEEIEDLSQEIETLRELLKENAQIQDFTREIENLERSLAKLELTAFFSGENDHKNALVGIHAGQGGVEAMDWAGMLFRMYKRYCENKNWKTEIIDMTQGEEAGIKSVVFRVSGKYAYGCLKGEAGTHRLVRQSPFNADNLRQTSFALVEVLPEFEEVDLPDIKINDDDIDIGFFRSSSQGGQNVQKVSTAVRIVHKPTGTVVTAQSERFQEQNRKNALNLLRSKLWLLQKEKARQTKNIIKGQYQPASWGTQIRSYVLHPYKMVKDLRTNEETSKTDEVLAGELDNFIDAEVRFLAKD